jgi:signal transduction histidine kinase
VTGFKHDRCHKNPCHESFRCKIAIRTITDTTGQNPANESVVVRIEDTGSGIAEDKLDKLFEPFFTTKPVGSGTGLGLSVSRNIIELHRGSIKIANRTDIRGVAVIIVSSSEQELI